MDNINNNIADNNQSNVNTNPANTYNSIQPSPSLMGNTNVNMSGTKPNDNVVDDLSATPSVDSRSIPAEGLQNQEPVSHTVPSDIQNTSDVSGSVYNPNLVENLSGVEPITQAYTPTEGLQSQEPVSQTLPSDIQNTSDVSGSVYNPNLVENLSGVEPITQAYTHTEGLPSQEPVSQTLQNDIQNVSEQPSLAQEAIQTNSIDMSAPLSQPISSILETSSLPQQSVPSFESSNTSMQTPIETTPVPAFNEADIINTFGNEKTEKKEGNIVVIILIIVIVILLLAIGYFAYKVFFV